jgi:hypothetical protein
VFDRSLDQPLVLIPEPGRIGDERVGLRRSRVSRVEVALDLAPHGEDDLGLSLVRHLGPRSGRRVCAVAIENASLAWERDLQTARRRLRR